MTLKELTKKLTHQLTDQQCHESVGKQALDMKVGKIVVWCF